MNNLNNQIKIIQEINTLSNNSEISYDEKQIACTFIFTITIRDLNARPIQVISRSHTFESEYTIGICESAMVFAQTESECAVNDWLNGQG